jgi:predicted peptidase
MHRTIEREVSLRYLLFLPRDYDAASEKRWPTILFLHGSGERGDDLELVKVHGPPKIVASKPDFPFIVVSPQCPSGRSWNNDELNALLDDVIERCAVDTNRVYLTGLSMGGFGAWDLALANPERFAAVVPICGGGEPMTAFGYASDSQKARDLKALPFWAFHGAKDTTVAPAQSEAMVNALRKLGCQVEYTVYPDAEHDAWTRTYDDPKLYEWFLAHERKH